RSAPRPPSPAARTAAHTTALPAPPRDGLADPAAPTTSPQVSNSSCARKYQTLADTRTQKMPKPVSATGQHIGGSAVFAALRHRTTDPEGGEKRWRRGHGSQGRCSLLQCINRITCRRRTREHVASSEQVATQRGVGA